MPHELTIDPEFAAFCGQSTEEERQLLEASLLEEGCREPIIVWANHGDVILDGHTRYEVCTKHNIKFSIKPLVMQDRAECIAWIDRNQRGRRNVSEDQKQVMRERAFEMGERYLAEKKQGERTDLTSGHGDHKSTAESIAKDYDTSAKTVRRNAQLVNAYNIIAADDPDLANRLKSEAHPSVIVETAKLDPEDRTAFAKRCMESPAKKETAKPEKTKRQPSAKSCEELANEADAWVRRHLSKCQPEQVGTIAAAIRHAVDVYAYALTEDCEGQA